MALSDNRPSFVLCNEEGLFGLQGTEVKPLVPVHFPPNILQHFLRLCVGEVVGLIIDPVSMELLSLLASNDPPVTSSFLCRAS